jgi:hydroxyacylglutathione hydrolase
VRIPGIDVEVSEGDDGFCGRAGDLIASVIDVPGHTRDHIVYYVSCASDSTIRILFSGDTLFSMGCGRLFEGTPQQMHASLNKIAALHKDTLVLCAHEYTESNGRFAKHVEPTGNAELDQRIEEVRQLRMAGNPTLPVSLGTELSTNPFLRTSSAVIRSSLGLDSSTPDDLVFAALRKRKDSF